jgi:RNA polymerase sigma factor (sigma-70 family)
MTQGQPPSVLRQLRRLLAVETSGDRDAQLLDRFVRQGDEDAFAELVERHEGLVLGVCRRLLRQTQDVEDLFQATFLVLACKAGSIGKRQSVASWLHKVAYRMALRERTRRAARSRREVPVGHSLDELAQTAEPSHDRERQELCQVVDEEVHRLPEKYRAPVVLCYLEGRTNEQAAQEMRCPVGTVVTRLARARKRLHSRLIRRGLGVSVGLLAADLARAGTAPRGTAALRELTIKAALPYAAHRAAAGLISTKVAALTRGAMTAMTLSKLKVAAAVVLVLCLLGTGTGLWTYHALAAERPIGRTPVASPLAALSLPEFQRPDPAPAKRATPAEDPPVKKATDKDGQFTAKEVLTHSFKTGKAPRLTVESYNGGIDVKVGEANRIEARVTKQGKAKTEAAAQEALKRIDVQFTQDGDTVKVTARDKEEHDPTSQTEAGIEVTVPAAAVLDLHTSNGGVTVTGGTGNVGVKTANGGIRVKDSKGSLKLDTSNGAIKVNGATGRMELKTTNGSVEIHGEKARVSARSTNGAVHFEGSLGEGDQSFRTTNGGIVLTLPADAHFQVEADTSLGHITSEFEPGPSKAEANHWRATVGTDPKTTIKLHTSNGSIKVRRQKAAE